MRNLFLILLFISTILFFTSCSPRYTYYPYAVPNSSLSGELLSLRTVKIKDTSSSLINGVVLGREHISNTRLDSLGDSIIVLINHSRSDTTTTLLSDNQGKFESKLHAGTYTLRFMQGDYNILEIQGLHLKVGESTKLDVILGSMGSLGQKNPKILKIE
jgi:hypothetical protein